MNESPEIKNFGGFIVNIKGAVYARKRNRRFPKGKPPAEDPKVLIISWRTVGALRKHAGGMFLASTAAAMP